MGVELPKQNGWKHAFLKATFFVNSETIFYEVSEV